MTYKVIWSNKAEVSFSNTIDYIHEHWSPREALKLIARTDEVITIIAKHPYLFKEYRPNPSIRHGILHKNTTMFYRVMEESKTILIMLFWNNSRNPKSLDL
ncbi:MAG TPA: type II toxin-antitoxin system RelE/ParE family toxin [Daejeonella sp.]|nr:type II toxin-antitoxin system RelE/ParE family toxin [Daejeonella sp.]